MTDPWWPPGYDLPAFRLKRQRYGLNTGGDYVRGSSTTTLPQTALRYQSVSQQALDTGGQAKLFVRPFDYNSTEIFWSWPKALLNEWIEVALVRSSFGAPATPRDGETVWRTTRSEFDENVLGQKETDLLAPPVVYDMPLPSGRWYYYALFFRSDPTNWTIGMTDACLLPRDWKHREHMWDVVPPYYQWMDNQYRSDNGYLRQFLTVFGFEMDHTREYVESLLHLYMLDWTPMSLLKQLGANFGVPYESGIGEIRYRGLVCYIPGGLNSRGTASGLEGMVEAVSKYRCTVTPSTNLLLLPDDSDFYTGTGNWGGVHPDVNPTSILGITYLSWDKVHVAKDDGTHVPEVGRNSMRLYTVKADQLAELVIACGDTRVATGLTTHRDIIPLNGAVPVTEGRSYGLSMQVKVANAGVKVDPIIVWVDSTGQPTAIVQTNGSADPDLGAPDTNWNEYSVVGTAKKTVHGAPAYLDTALGFGSSTQLLNDQSGLPIEGTVVLTARVMLPASPLPARLIFAEWNSGSQKSWAWGIINNKLTYEYSTDGTAVVQIAVANIVDFPALGAGPYTFGIRVSKNLDGVSRVAALIYDDDSHQWSEFGLPVKGTALPNFFPVSSGALSIGNKSARTGSKLYWAEVRTGEDPTSGFLSARFDPANWFAGTSWTDPRNRAWSISASGCVTLTTPATPGAQYLVPMLHIYARVAGSDPTYSPSIYVSGVMVYALGGDDAEVSVIAPDRYLKVGVASELMGDPHGPGAPPDMGDHIMGAPRGS